VDYLIKFLTQILVWLLAFLKWGVDWCWNELMVAFATVLSAIPVPQWLADAPSVVGQLPAGVAYLATSLAIPQGLSIIIGAYVIRFIIRRLPIIG
jgi:hypothetical protein